MHCPIAPRRKIPISGQGPPGGGVGRGPWRGSNPRGLVKVAVVEDWRYCWCLALGEEQGLAEIRKSTRLRAPRCCESNLID